jgi:hypothetical protein
MVLTCIRAERVTICIKSRDVLHKIFKISFMKKPDGALGLVVHMPYFQETKAIIAKTCMPANVVYATERSLIPEGKLVSHHIKYTHWSDGNAHFSQKDKIYTKVKNGSSPLSDSVGHIFTLQIQGIEGFTSAVSKRFKSTDTDVDFTVPDEYAHDAFKFVGYWYKAAHLKGNADAGPLVSFQNKDGSYDTGYLLSPPVSFPLDDFVLYLTCTNVEVVDRAAASSISFIGGFDPHSIVLNLEKDYHFLAYGSPIDGFDDLTDILECIDYQTQPSLSIDKLEMPEPS